MAISDCFVSVLAPLSNDAAIVGGFIAEVITVLRDNYTNYELVLVDDGSEDDTVAKVTALLKQYECIRLIRLSRNFGEEIAISAGLETVIGDFVVVMLPASDPTEVIAEMVQLARNKPGVVFGVRQNNNNDPLLFRIGRKWFYWYCEKILNLSLAKDSTQFRVLSRQAVNGITQVKDKYRYLRVLSAYVGYASQSYCYEPVKRKNKTKIGGFFTKVNRGMDVIVGNSYHPLRFVSWVGFGASALNLAYICYIVAVFFLRDKVAEGWTTSSLQNAGMFFFIFLILTVLCEYVGRILEEAKDRPLYYILDERSSSVMLADQDRRNVVKDSAQVMIEV